MEKKEHISHPETVISIKGLYKSFDELDILEDVNLEIYKGENVVVLGRSGTGKSVLIKILIGLIPPDKGTLTILGKDITKLKPKELDELRLRIGFCFQHGALYDSMSVRENMEFPLKMNNPKFKKQEINQAVEEVLEAVGLSDKIDVMPGDLSGGQRKRIGIARTLILKPEIMFYDEPTAGLDPITSAEINELIREVQQKYNTSSIIITHDLTCAKMTGDRVAMLIDRRFVRTGTFEEVFETESEGKADEQISSFFNYNFTQEP